MVKYRPHRGSLSESMNEYVEFTDITYMLKYISNESGGLIDMADIVIGASHGKDDRIDWTSTRYVLTRRYGDDQYNTSQCIGMCDLGECD